MAEKSEKATPKKLKDAKKKGQVAKSQDFPAAFTFSASMLLLLAMASYMYDQIGTYMVSMFTIAPTVDLTQSIGTIMDQTLMVILNVTLPISGIVAAIGVTVNFLIIGPMWASEAMKIDLKKLDPIQGLRNKFKMRTFVELIKSLLKITVAAYLIYSVMKSAMPILIQTAAMTLYESAMVVAEFIKLVAIRVGIFFVAVAIFDLVFQKRDFAKSMKMEKFEVKQEHKDLEGAPEIKQRRRQIAQEVAYDSGPGAAKKAKVVVTNPTHIAVALGYDPTKYAAPFILTLGIDNRAGAIIRVAEKSNVPIMRNVQLAHDLFEQGAVNRFIPEETYDAVAEILRWVISLEE